MTNYLVASHRKIYASMDGARAEEAGVSPETKHHPHVVIGPLTFGGADAIHAAEGSSDMTLSLIVYGVVSIGGDWTLYPLQIKPEWPPIQTPEDIETRRDFIRSLLMADVKRICGVLNEDLTLGDEEGN